MISTRCHNRNNASDTVLSARRYYVLETSTDMPVEKIIHVRRHVLGVSQALFAQLFNVALQTVHAWEQGARKPSGSAIRLLKLAEERPEAMRRLIVARTERNEGHHG